MKNKFRRLSQVEQARQAQLCKVKPITSLEVYSTGEGMEPVLIDAYVWNPETGVLERVTFDSNNSTLQLSP